MKKQEAVQAMKFYKEKLYNGIFKDKIQAFDVAINAIEKRIPKAPDLEADGYDEKGELVYDTGYCPECRHVFEVYYDSPKYCPDCGQALDWSDVE